MEYRIVTHWNARELAQQVTELLAIGWVCQGGVTLAVAPGGDERYAQAMTRSKQ